MPPSGSSQVEGEERTGHGDNGEQTQRGNGGSELCDQPPRCLASPPLRSCVLAPLSSQCLRDRQGKALT